MGIVSRTCFGTKPSNTNSGQFVPIYFLLSKSTSCKDKEGEQPIYSSIQRVGGRCPCLSQEVPTNNKGTCTKRSKCLFHSKKAVKRTSK